MLEELLRLLKAQKNLIDEAEENALEMFARSQDMLDIAFGALKGDVVDDQLKEKIKKMDITINKRHRETRKMIIEHLVISKGEALIQGLQLAVVIDNLERIGDYIKNLVELACMLEHKPSLPSYLEDFISLSTKTKENYQNTVIAFREDDAGKAEQAIKLFTALSKICNEKIEALFQESDEKISKETMGFLLFLRYIKRINSHLTNIATSIIYPFHEIGYRKNVL